MCITSHHRMAAYSEIHKWFNWNTKMENFPEFREILVHPDNPKVLICTRVFGNSEKEFNKYSAKLLKLEVLRNIHLINQILSGYIGIIWYRMDHFSIGWNIVIPMK